MIKNDKEKTYAVIGNDINNAIFKDLTASDMNIFLVCCMLAKDQGTTLVNIPFSVLREKSNHRKGSNKDFSEELKTLANKLLDTRIYVVEDNGWAMFNLFQTFRASEEKAMLSIRVSEDWQYALNSIINNFSQIEYGSYVKIRKKYAKRMFMKMCQYRKNGWWKVSIDDLRNIIDIPNSCPDRAINAKIIQPAIIELKPFFKKLIGKKENDYFVFEFEFLNKPPKIEREPSEIMRNNSLQIKEREKKPMSAKQNKFHNFHQREQDEEYYIMLEKALLQ